VLLFALLFATCCWSSGCVGVTSSKASTIPVSQPAALAVTPSSVSVSTVVGTTGSQTITATNHDTTGVAINQVTVTGPGFSFSTKGLAVPGSLAPGASQNFDVVFAATTPGNATGSLTILTSAGASPVVVPLSATAATSSSTPPSGTASAPVSSVSVSPSAPSVTTDGTMQFSATVQGSSSNKSVTWIAQRGTISSAGAYVAPSSVGTDTVTATSAADTSKFATATISITAPVASGALPAFPGAEGGGAASLGGRGGQVFEVTNLNDSGPGSLRACTSANGPRTCIFRVAGIVTPASRYRISNPFLTIACQTAPGEVIIGGPSIASQSSSPRTT
jgi:hypothetical protein